MKDRKESNFIGGAIINGKYVRRMPTPQLRPDTLMFKSFQHDAGRKDHARDIIQPFNRDGSPNEDFVNAFPTEAKQYGFLPSDEQIRKKG